MCAKKIGENIKINPQKQANYRKVASNSRELAQKSIMIRSGPEVPYLNNGVMNTLGEKK